MQNYDKGEKLRASVQHIGLFETPVAYCKLDDGEALMNSLESSIRNKKKEDAGLNRSNIGGWHSDTDMLAWAGPGAETLAETAVRIARRMSHFQDSSVDNYDWVVRMWANVTPPGGLNHLHSHPGNFWAAVLYIDMGDGDGEQHGGEFYMEDPRFPMAAMKDTAFRMIGPDGEPQRYELEFRLQRGNLIVFPAWVRHGVRRYTGSRERISIAMNIDALRR